MTPPLAARHPWLVKPRFNIILILLLFIVISGATALFISRQYEDATKQAAASDRMVTDLLSDIIREHETAAINILQSYASRPLFINAVERRDAAAAGKHLQALKNSNSEMDTTFIADKKGVLWADYPFFPEAIGVDRSQSDWYKGVSSKWEPYISTVFRQILGAKALAVAVAVPIFDQRGHVIGILANAQRLDFLADTIRRITLETYTGVMVIDSAGNIIYSNTRPYTAGITRLPALAFVRKAMREGRNQIEAHESPNGAGPVLYTVNPVAEIGWTVIVEHKKKDVAGVAYGQMAVTAATSLLLFIALSLLLLYTRKHSLLAEAETRFRAAVEGSLDAFFVFRSVRDKAGRIIDFEFEDMNARAEKIISMSRQQVIGQKLCELIPVNRTDGFFDKYVQVVETGETLDEEFAISTNRIEPSWIHHQVVPLADGVAIISRDISGRKRKEEEIRRLNQDLLQRTAQLQISNQELESFAYSVSHDLRAPLRGIDGWSLALLEDYGDKLDEQACKYLSRVRSETQRMGMLIDDMLKLSRVTRAEMQSTPIDLADKAVAGGDPHILSGGTGHRSELRPRRKQLYSKTG
jgi:PAS domain S-box-containing protein